MDGGAQHQPVLVAETLDLLGVGRGGVFLDCTVGLGGHAAALLEADPQARLVGTDRDPRALELAAERLAPFRGRWQLVEARFGELGEALAAAGVDKVDGWLADLGVSSMQLEVAERGFSFRREGPLDMRMGSSELTASDIVNRYGGNDLEKIFRDYGEERQARRIAQAIVATRKEKPLETTTELARLVRRAKGGGGTWRRIDPATRVFQALRIEVNRELSGIAKMLDEVTQLLEYDGRLVVISYHSLEDRLVKDRLRELARGHVDRVTGRPSSEGRLLEILTRKPVRPGEDEVAANPRARSARLRAARRL